MIPPEASKLRLLFQPAVLVGALGYFVDIYDLLLFNIIRIPSLKDRSGFRPVRSARC